MNILHIYAVGYVATAFLLSLLLFERGQPRSDDITTFIIVMIGAILWLPVVAALIPALLARVVRRL